MNPTTYSPPASSPLYRLWSYVAGMPDWGMDGRRRLFACNGHLARIFGVCRRTIQRWKKALVRGGWLIPAGRVGKGDCYLLWEPGMADVTLNCVPTSRVIRTSSPAATPRRKASSLLERLTRAFDPYYPPHGMLPRAIWKAASDWHVRTVGQPTLARGKVLGKRLRHLTQRWSLVPDAEIVKAIERAETLDARFGTCEDAMAKVDAELVAMGHASIEDRKAELRRRIEQLKRIMASE
jgi:hypothetical protein